MTKLIQFTIILLLALQANAQLPKTDPLFKEIKSLDSVFFERGFNRCDMAYLEEAVTEDLRFFHDLGGYDDKKQFIEKTRKNICGNSQVKPIRKADTSGFEIFPLHNDGKLYGAIQHGIHYFYLRQEGKADVPTGIARFTSVWVKENGLWKLKEVLSYDHKPFTYSNSRKEVFVETKVLDRYAGLYAGPGNLVTIVKREGKDLIMQIDNKTFHLSAESDNVFFLKDRDLTFEFSGTGTSDAVIVVRENGDVVDKLKRKD